MEKQITCSKCGGAGGTLRKDGDTGLYIHMRAIDCQYHRRKVRDDEELEKIWSQRKSVV